MTVRVFDSRRCALGEGLLWHPGREQLFWFDILGKRLMSREASGPLEWAFDEHVSAAGWIERDTLVIASESALFRFDLTSGAREDVIALEAGNLVTRSNDGRADPWGGFWIGTMGKNAEPGAGAIYRHFRGKLELLYSDITISNAICFAPDRSYAYYTDTPTRQIMRQALKKDGWPSGPAEVFIDLTKDGLNPDGAVVDAEGCLWIAQWGASRVARYTPDGTFLSAVEFEASQISCPAFGGEDMKMLFATSAADGMTSAADGQTFLAMPGVTGQAEHQVKL